MMASVDRELLDLLPAYGRGELEADRTREIEALLTGYLDGLLDAESEAAIERVIESHPGLAEEIGKARAGKDILDELLPPADGPLEDPDSPAIQGLLDDLYTKASKAEAAEKPAAEASNVVILPTASRRHRPIWYALAAAIAVALIGGGGWLAATLQQRFDQAREQQAALQTEIELLESERQERQVQIASLDGKIGHLTADLTKAEADRDRLAAEVDARLVETTSLRDELDRADARLSAIEAERRQLAGAIERLSANVEQTAEARDAAEATLAEAQSKQTMVEAEVARLSDALANAEVGREGALAELAETSERLAGFRQQQQTLEQQMAALETDLERSTVQQQNVEDEKNALAADLRRVGNLLAGVEQKTALAETALAAAESKRVELAEALAEASTELADVKTAKRSTEVALAEANGTINTLQGERTALEQQVASLTLEAETRTAALSSNRQRLAALGQQLDRAQTDLSEAEQQIADQAIARAALDHELADLRLRQEWTYQVAQYHTVFANQPRRRWVDAEADERDRLNALLSDLGTELGLARPLSLPEDLAESDFTFTGARQLVINGRPVAQLVYADQQKELFAFCITRNMSGKAQDIKRHRVNTDLHLADWKDQDFSYVVVGYEPVDVVKRLAEELRGSYRL